MLIALNHQLEQTQKELNTLKEKNTHLQSILSKQEAPQLPSLAPKELRSSTKSNKALQIAFSNNFISSQNIQIRDPSLSRISIKIEEVNDYKVRSLIGGYDKETLIAFKDAASFLIITSEKGIMLREKNQSLYLEKLETPSFWNTKVSAVVYANHLDCYFFTISQQIYQKDIDQKPPFNFMSLGLTPFGLFYSKLNQRFLFSSTNLYVLNPLTKKIDFQVVAIFGKLGKFRLLGKDRFVGFCQNSFSKVLVICLGKFSCERQSGRFVQHVKLDLDRQKSECVASFAACQKNRYIFVEVQAMLDVESWFCSKMLIFDCFDDNLTLKVNLDPLKENMAIKKHIHCAGYDGHCALWVALSTRKTSQIFVYDTKKEGLSELKEKRVKYQDRASDQIHPVGGDLFFITNSGKLNKLTCLKNDR